jgi:hypothetical protein
MLGKDGPRAYMPNSLLSGRDLDSNELRILLHELIGGGQAELKLPNSNRFYLPEAGPNCRVVLTLKNKKVSGIEPGPAFDAAQWGEISNEIDHLLMAGPTKIGREYSFSGYRVTGSWRGEHSGIQILPAAAGAPSAPVELADHPFILEFPFVASASDSVTSYRRLRKHRDLTFLLNILLIGGAKSMWYRPASFWAVDPNDLGQSPKWVQEGFFASLGPCVADDLSPVAHPLQELPPDQYEAVWGHDGEGLRVPSDLDQSICSYEALSGSNREKFDRAAFWFGIASEMRDVSVSASFAAFASAIESLTSRGKRHNLTCPVCGRQTDHEFPGPTKLFRNFLDTYAAGASLAEERKQINQMYAMRSTILHGGDVMEIDQSIPTMAWSPWGFKERELYNSTWKVTRAALRNWVKSPPPRSTFLQEAREVRAYFHWIERGQPLWEADIDWACAVEEFPA